jgi:hypothetical protein
MNIYSDNNIQVLSKDYEEVYRLAEALVATQSVGKIGGTDHQSHRVSAAKALMEAIDQATESNIPSLIFTEEEILVLANNEDY